MDEYIKREDAIKVIVNNPYRIALKTVKTIQEIKEIPTADVVPKSEVDRLNAVIKEMDEQRVYTINMLGESLENAKAEVAIEIFEELETKTPWFCENQTAYEHFNEELAELKKKYTEEKSNVIEKAE